MKNFLTSLFTLTGCWNVCFRLLLLSHVFTLLTMCIVTSRTLLVDDFWVFLSQVLCRRNSSRVEQSSTWARGQPEAGRQPNVRDDAVLWTALLLDSRLTQRAQIDSCRILLQYTARLLSNSVLCVFIILPQSAGPAGLAPRGTYWGNAMQSAATRLSIWRPSGEVTEWWYYLGEDGEIVGQSPDILSINIYCSWSYELPLPWIINIQSYL